MQDTWYSITGYRIQGRVQYTGYRIQDTEYCTRYKTPWYMIIIPVGYRIQDAG